MFSWRSWSSSGRKGLGEVREERVHESETQRVAWALLRSKPCKQTVNVTDASVSDKEVRSAMSWIDRVELS
jgi:hypothetical protein